MKQTGSTEGLRQKPRNPFLTATVTTSRSDWPHWLSCFGPQLRIQEVRPITLLRLPLLRFLDSKCLGHSLWTWEFHPFKTKIMLESTPSEIQNLSSEIGRITTARKQLRLWTGLGLQARTRLRAARMTVHVRILIPRRIHNLSLYIYIYMYVYIICIPISISISI